MYYTPMPSQDRRRLLLDSAGASEPGSDSPTTAEPAAGSVNGADDVAGADTTGIAAAGTPEKPAKRPRARRATRGKAPVKGTR